MGKMHAMSMLFQDSGDEQLVYRVIFRKENMQRTSCFAQGVPSDERLALLVGGTISGEHSADGGVQV